MNLVPPWFEADLQRLDALLAQDATNRSIAPLKDAPRTGTDAVSAATGTDQPWNSFVERLGLEPFERDLFLLALAPDLDPRYGALYLLLYGTRRPSAELALRLLAESWTTRGLAAPDAKLFRLGLLEALPAAEGTSWLARPLAPPSKLAEALIRPSLPVHLPGNLPFPAVTLAEIDELKNLPKGSTVYLEGSDAALLLLAARAVAGGRCVETDPLVAIGRGAVLLCDSTPDDPSVYPLVLVRGAEPKGPHRRLVVPALNAARRTTVWREALLGHAIDADPQTVAQRFLLGLDQIHSAAAHVASRPAPHDLFGAAAAQTIGPIAELAQQVKGTQGWQDLVVPDATIRRLRTVASAIDRRRQVFDDWGFGRRLGGGGLKALFSGPSGTGKTMAVGILGRELGLHVFRVDLATTVSKYIGETEKNLARVFDAAAISGAILFFDEADAIFGKRSEVKDAHDRYANLEVAYLLQRMEDYDGAVILATNLSHNLDEAFSRRLHYVVEFPVPDASLRQRLWKGVFPATAPIGEDLDFDFLADRFELTGGKIQTVTLDAAFMAARENSPIHMHHLVRALAHQLTKEGRIPSPNDFGYHYESAISLVDV